jgi:hypothetical protein
MIILYYYVHRFSFSSLETTHCTFLFLRLRMNQSTYCNNKVQCSLSLLPRCGTSTSTSNGFRSGILRVLVLYCIVLLQVQYWIATCFEAALFLPDSSRQQPSSSFEFVCWNIFFCVRDSNILSRWAVTSLFCRNHHQQFSVSTRLDSTRLDSVSTRLRLDTD